MRDDVYYNGINFIGNVLRGVLGVKSLKQEDRDAVMAHIIDPGLDFLDDECTEIPTENGDFDVLYDGLDDETLVVDPEAAYRGMMRMRAYYRLMEERTNASRKPVECKTSVMTITFPGRVFVYPQNESNDVCEEQLLAQELVELYDIWKDVDVGDMGELKYAMLMMALDLIEDSLDEMDEEDDARIELEGLLAEAEEKRAKLLDAHPEYIDEGRWPNCNRECDACSHYGVDCGAEEGGDADEE